MVENNKDQSINEQSSDQADDMMFRVNLQYLKKISYSSPSSPQIFATKPVQPEVKVNVDVKVDRLNEVTYEVVLGVHTTAKDSERDHYELDLQYSAIVTFKDEFANIEEGTDEDYALKYQVMVTVPTLLFPYVREIVSNTVREGAFAIVLLEPINFHSLFVQKMEEEKKSSKK